MTLAGDIVESIMVQDDSGEACRVFIDGYIGYSDSTSQALEEFVKEGAQISAAGFVSHDAEGNRLRVRDRSEIRLEEETQEPLPEIYDVTVSVQNGSFEGPETAEQGSDYTGTVQAAEGYRLPETITVKVAGQELAASAYDYDAAVGTVSIPGEQVNGDLEIMVSCVLRQRISRDSPEMIRNRARISRDSPGMISSPGSDSQNQDQQQNQGGKIPREVILPLKQEMRPQQECGRFLQSLRLQARQAFWCGEEKPCRSKN